MMPKRRGISGQIFNNIKVIRATGDKYRGSYIWEVECLLCGRRFTARIGQITHGSIKSCGCVKTKNLRTMSMADKLGLVGGTNVSRIASEHVQSNNTSGYKGVYLCRRKGKADRWQAYIYFCGKKYCLGNFLDIEDAAKARQEAEKHIFGDFLTDGAKLNPNRMPDRLAFPARLMIRM